MAKHNELGVLGEGIAGRFLVKRSFKILSRNYKRPCGELDIVALYKGIIHFVEVKSVSCDLSGFDVTQETSSSVKDIYRPEDNLHRDKVTRLKRVIQTYLMDKRVSDETIWQFDVVTVFINEEKKRARVKFIEDIILD